MSVASATETKTCSRCLVELPRADFAPDRKSRDGLSYYCRPCHLALRKGIPPTVKSTMERICAHPGCTTKLSRYNRGTLCGTHEAMQAEAALPPAVPAITRPAEKRKEVTK